MGIEPMTRESTIVVVHVVQPRLLAPATQNFSMFLPRRWLTTACTTMRYIGRMRL